MNPIICVFSYLHFFLDISLSWSYVTSSGLLLFVSYLLLMEFSPACRKTSFCYTPVYFPWSNHSTLYVVFWTEAWLLFVVYVSRPCSYLFLLDMRILLFPLSARKRCFCADLRISMVHEFCILFCFAIKRILFLSAMHCMSQIHGSWYLSYL